MKYMSPMQDGIETEDPKTLVRRAIEIWKAANEILPQASEADLFKGGVLSFEEIGNKKLLPARHGGRSHVDSRNGVKKVVEGYFSLLQSRFYKVFKNRGISDDQLKLLNQQLKELKEEVLKTGELSSRVLEALKKYQINMRKHKNHEVTAFEIGELLGGVDIGVPNSMI
jgi:hypothetical protein